MLITDIHTPKQEKQAASGVEKSEFSGFYK